MSEQSAALFADLNAFVVAGADDVRHLLTELNAICLVVDHYGLDADFERRAAGGRAVTVVIDDLANRPHACDILVDANPARKASDYAPHTSPGTRLLLGSRYALLRADFARSRHPLSATAKRLVVALGGGDSGGAAERVLDTLPQLEVAGLRTTLIIGRANARHAELARRAAAVGADLVRDPADVVALMAAADIAISGGGTTCLEFACLGVPMVALILADNQRSIARAMGLGGAAQILEADEILDPSKLADPILAMAEDLELRRRMSAAGRAMVDGQGAARVAGEAAGLAHGRH
jgi:UDP-2,4-diacetamido-2,4,6-trideoxy-beta-L-altropyranose hydrolase